MAAVDADYKFIWYEVGTNRAASDSQIFKDCDLYDAIQDGSLNMPPPDCLPNDDTPKPYYFISDDAFALKTRLMKPHANRNLTLDPRVFNYHLSRARRIVESFFRHFSSKIWLPAGNHASSNRNCSYHYQGGKDIDYNLQPGFWRRIANMHDKEQHTRGSADERRARKLHMYLTHYVNSPAGSVPWQNRKIGRPLAAHPKTFPSALISATPLFPKQKD